MPTLKMIQGDSKPSVDATLLSNGVATNLTGATVQFRHRQIDTLNTIVGAAVIISAVAGTVSYLWAVNETANMAIGNHAAQFRVTFSDGSILTFPDCDTDLIVEICELV